MRARPFIDNATARRLFLDRHALVEAPSGPAKGAELQRLIDRLGFVQVDSINTVSRAHHMILHARRPAYREKHLKPLLEKSRSLFEHWTHDASVVPASYFPHWRLRFERDRRRLRQQWKNWRRDGFEEKFDAVLNRIAAQGPCCSADVGEGEERGSGGWWDWHPSKTALEYLWRTGEIAVTRRDGFRKVYDLTENVLPREHLTPRHDPEETIDWACNAALDRLGLATSGEIAAFWALVNPGEAKQWCSRALEQGEIAEVDIETDGGGRPRASFMRPELLDALAALPRPAGQLRILSPFDPALRDRKRAERLFGFDYRIEVFVPEAKRIFGYYVFPVLEGDRLTGRIDMKCQRQADRMHVRAFWPEKGVRAGKGRLARLEAALDRLARLAGVSQVSFEDGWLRPPNLVGHARS